MKRRSLQPRRFAQFVDEWGGRPDADRRTLRDERLERGGVEQAFLTGDPVTSREPHRRENRRTPSVRQEPHNGHMAELSGCQPQVHERGATAQIQVTPRRIMLGPESLRIGMHLDEPRYDPEPPRMHVMDRGPHRRGDDQTFRWSVDGNRHTHEAFLLTSAGRPVSGNTSHTGRRTPRGRGDLRTVPHRDPTDIVCERRGQRDEWCAWTTKGALETRVEI
jgi:hypothetical protein